MYYNYKLLVGYHLDVNCIGVVKIETEGDAKRYVEKIMEVSSNDFLQRIKLSKGSKTFTPREYGTGISLHDFLIRKNELTQRAKPPVTFIQRCVEMALVTFVLYLIYLAIF